MTGLKLNEPDRTDAEAMFRLESSGGEKIDMTPYCGDDYDRTGCSACIEVTKDGYRLQTFAPNGARMEVYGRVKSPRAISRMLEEWCAGCAPRLNARLDQAGASGSCVIS